MKIGITYDLKEDFRIGLGRPEDALEEYDSPETVEAIAGALESAGHSAVLLGGGREFLNRVLTERVDLVFNISEGLGSHRSREAQVPAVLEMLNIPYTGADPQCLAVCLDKPLAKKLVSAAGVLTPDWVTIYERKQISQKEWDEFPWPAFVKPAYDGSSKGVRFGSKVNSVEALTGLTEQILEDYSQPVLIEQYIDGDEITVGLIGNPCPDVAGVMRILPRENTREFIYSLEVKRDWERLVKYECPADLPDDVLRRIVESSRRVFRILGCRDFARIDFRLDRDGWPYFLEINPLAGLNPASSDLPIMARKMGWSYDRLILAILDAALERQECRIAAG